MAMNCPFVAATGETLEKYLAKLWVGETIMADLDNYEYEVLEGAENIEIGAPYGIENYTRGIKLLNTGTAKIKVTSKENTEDSEIYDFTILPATEPYVEYLVPKKIKIGYTTDYMYTYHDCLLDSYSHGYDMSELTWNDWDSYFLRGINWGGAYGTSPETRTVGGFLPGCATRPGTIHIAAKRDESNPYVVTIEEPVVNTNLPQRVQVGTELLMTTSLDNTVLENKKIADVRYSYPEQRFPLAYQPKVEIVSGAELVERSNGDYSNILNSSENIKFTGEGTVVFRVIYEMVSIDKVSTFGEPVAIEEEAIYNPEKKITIQVKEKSQNNTQSNKKIQKVSKITLSGISNKIAAGKKIKLTAKVSPSNAANKKAKWRSSNTKVATVSSSGVVTLKKKSAGKTVKITATATDGSGVKAQYKITSMKGAVKKIAISGGKSVKAGKTLKLKGKVVATHKKANTKLKWTSSNKKYATVNNSGKIKTYKAGKGKKVRITAEATDGSGKKKTVVIKIK